MNHRERNWNLHQINLKVHHLDLDVADKVRILYGGSVKAGNVKAIMEQPDVDGALIGGAALDPDEFLRIIRWPDQP